LSYASKLFIKPCGTGLITVSSGRSGCCHFKKYITIQRGFQRPESAVTEISICKRERCHQRLRATRRR